jgi:hypothetical protein
MDCPVCTANAEQIVTAIEGMGIICPTCGEYEVSSSVLAAEDWQRLDPDERCDVLDDAKRSGQPGVRLRSQTTCSQPTWSPPRNRQHYNLTNTRSPVPLLASLRCTPQRDFGSCRGLRGGHAACILVERVEKATDNRPARSLCYPKWLTLILRCDRPSLAPAHYARPLPRWGQRL